VRQLGQTICRDCESAPEVVAHSSASDLPQLAVDDAAAGSDEALAAEVAAAIDRVLGRMPAPLGPPE